MSGFTRFEEDVTILISFISKVRSGNLLTSRLEVV